MENEQHYFRVGMFIVVLALLAAAFAVWLVNTGRSDDVFYRIYFRESVSGLNEGSPVKYRGVEVGNVQTVAIDRRDSRRIKVDVKLLRTTPVKTDTTASLKLAGVTGAVYIDLSAGSSTAELLRDVSDDEIPVIRSEESTVNAIINQLPQIMEKLSKFSDQMNKLASDENVAALSGMFSNTEAITGDVRDIVQSSKSDSKQVMVNLRKASRDINEVTETVKENPSSLLFSTEEEGITPP